VKQHRGRNPGVGSEFVGKLDAGLDMDNLESLVNELAKQKPQEQRIKAYMQQVGLDYTADPIERLNLVLRAMEGRPGFPKTGGADGKNV
jgi:hypothetical protein